MLRRAAVLTMLFLEACSGGPPSSSRNAEVARFDASQEHLAPDTAPFWENAPAHSLRFALWETLPESAHARVAIASVPQAVQLLADAELRSVSAAQAKILTGGHLPSAAGSLYLVRGLSSVAYPGNPDLTTLRLLSGELWVNRIGMGSPGDIRWPEVVVLAARPTHVYVTSDAME